MKNILNTSTGFILLVCICLTSCYSVKKRIEQSKHSSEKINWPQEFKPDEASFFVHNEIDINAEPRVVWNILIQAEDWPNWYSGATDVKIRNTNSTQLTDETTFSWKTMGQKFESTKIKEFKPPYRLSWEASKNNIRGYHAWLIIPTDNGCKVITSEVQHGFLTLMQKTFIPNKLEKLHDIWLKELKNKAEYETKA